MQITDTIYQEIKQRLVHVKEEMRNSPEYPHEALDLVWLQGREVELSWIIDLLDELKEKENKHENTA